MTEKIDAEAFRAVLMKSIEKFFAEHVIMTASFPELYPPEMTIEDWWEYYVESME